MKLTVLGAGTIAPDPKHTQSGYLLEGKGFSPLLFDCGAGKILRLLGLGINAWTLERIFLSHFHLDHIAEVPSILFSKINPFLEGNADLTIYGPSEMSELKKKIGTFYEKMMTSDLYQLEFKDFPREEGLTEGPLKISAYPMNHFIETFGYRVEGEGKVFAYSGDTDVCSEAVDLGRDADLFVLECSLPSALKLSGHLTPREAGEIAAQARCKHLLLSHFYPQVLLDPKQIKREVRENYSGKLSLAEDLKVVEF